MRAGGGGGRGWRVSSPGVVVLRAKPEGPGAVVREVAMCSFLRWKNRECN